MIGGRTAVKYVDMMESNVQESNSVLRSDKDESLQGSFTVFAVEDPG